MLYQLNFKPQSFFFSFISPSRNYWHQLLCNHSVAILTKASRLLFPEENGPKSKYNLALQFVAQGRNESTAKNCLIISHSVGLQLILDQLSSNQRMSKCFGRTSTASCQFCSQNRRSYRIMAML